EAHTEFSDSYQFRGFRHLSTPNPESHTHATGTKQPNSVSEPPIPHQRLHPRVPPPERPVRLRRIHGVPHREDVLPEPLCGRTIVEAPRLAERLRRVRGQDVRPEVAVIT